MSSWLSNIGTGLSNFASTAKQWFNPVVQSVGNIASQIQTGVATVYGDAKGAIGKVYDGTIHVIDQGVGLATKQIDAISGVGNNLVTTAGNSLNSVASSLSLPLVIGGVGILGLFLLMKNK
jgi:hypothetical protein